MFVLGSSLVSLAFPGVGLGVSARRVSPLERLARPSCVLGGLGAPIRFSKGVAAPLCVLAASFACLARLLVVLELVLPFVFLVRL